MLSTTEKFPGSGLFCLSLHFSLLEKKKDWSRQNSVESNIKLMAGDGEWMNLIQYLLYIISRSQHISLEYIIIIYQHIIFVLLRYLLRNKFRQLSIVKFYATCFKKNISKTLKMYRVSVPVNTLFSWISSTLTSLSNNYMVFRKKV